MATSEEWRQRTPATVAGDHGGLDKWLVAVWCIVNAKNCISSCELARAIGVQQKSARHMLHRIRVVMAEESSDQLSGVVESDETFIGGKKKNMHKNKRDKMPKGRGTVGKAIVHGMLQRGNDEKPSQVRVGVVPNQKRKTLHATIEENVRTGITVYADALPSDEGLDWAYVHAMIDHAVQYVDGEIHTNGVEKLLVASEASARRNLRRRSSEAPDAVLCRTSLPVQQMRQRRLGPVLAGDEEHTGEAIDVPRSDGENGSDAGNGGVLIVIADRLRFLSRCIGCLCACSLRGRRLSWTIPVDGCYGSRKLARKSDFLGILDAGWNEHDPLVLLSHNGPRKEADRQNQERQQLLSSTACDAP